jgi:hypothetical protein
LPFDLDDDDADDEELFDFDFDLDFDFDFDFDLNKEDTKGDIGLISSLGGDRDDIGRISSLGGEGVAAFGADLGFLNAAIIGSISALYLS